MSYTDLRDAHDDMLDEVCGPVVIGTLRYQASLVLREVDPIAYRLSVDEYADLLHEDAEADGVCLVIEDYD